MFCYSEEIIMFHVKTVSFFFTLLLTLLLTVLYLPQRVQAYSTGSCSACGQTCGPTCQSGNANNYHCSQGDLCGVQANQYKYSCSWTCPPTGGGGGGGGGGGSCTVGGHFTFNGTKPSVAQFYAWYNNGTQVHFTVNPDANGNWTSSPPAGSNVFGGCNVSKGWTCKPGGAYVYQQNPCNSTISNWNFTVSKATPTVTPTPKASPTLSPTPSTTPTPSETPTPTLTPSPSPTPNPVCVCKSDNTCDTTCSFDEYPDVTYTTPLNCSREAGIVGPTPDSAGKTAYCQRNLRTKGDVDGDGTVTNTDYYYYVSAVNRGGLPLAANPDINGDGVVSVTDGNIIVKTLAAQ